MKEGYELIYKRPKTLTTKRMHYCPGCFHSTIHKLLMEIVEEMDIQDRTVGVCPVGCSVFAYDYLDVDMQEAAHGRAAAVATAIKRMLPDRYVFSYQGDGDLAAIGTAETIHACNRGENFTFIFINNGIYGMTGGQMAPTTLEGQKTTTTPYGRNVATAGMPLKMAEMVSQLEKVAYVERVSCNTPANARKAKRALRRAFEIQGKGLGTTFVEVASNCPSGWKCTPVQSLDWLKDRVYPYYPLGVFKEPPKEQEQEKE
ncbi:MAG: 2-oxoglutarate oxidoreductase [Candidatus Aminicenantes bacterium]|nr:2-oxoglutarate oxidoreductase [Candidatus Aminicenantes bacterium]NIM81148.1 2-oxoglutarate oxidoreductase [Candidatus Aminicenantes bacterium]NIN20522.1 2-oxoglutarate oxidoreductase [Candidatus Aminicenantes bacterium]NIN44295.1 2-oxoglutarate oxidoreductase [Candidatus Aminicenantes bacterium]NIN87114.1 2-oxoglutarate oxidoreductase [Candidatus Aminicenantes bacterium]